jgi:hypothetical protein
MPDTRSHRGPDPEDARLFGPDALDRLRQATSDLCWLLSRGYAIRSAVELVGNRHALTARQRMAVARSACADEAAASRRAREAGEEELGGQELWIDGLNVLTGLEVALSGGVILVGRDGCCRDIAGLHRHYRKVEETAPALELVGALVRDLQVRRVCWWLDKPVSNTGRLKTLILELASQSGWNWEVELVNNPDAVLCRATAVVASADSVILDRCQRWANLVRWVVTAQVPDARMLVL